MPIFAPSPAKGKVPKTAHQTRVKLALGAVALSLLLWWVVAAGSASESQAVVVEPNPDCLSKDELTKMLEESKQRTAQLYSRIDILETQLKRLHNDISTHPNNADQSVHLVLPTLDPKTLVNPTKIVGDSESDNSQAPNALQEVDEREAVEVVRPKEATEETLSDSVDDQDQFVAATTAKHIPQSVLLPSLEDPYSAGEVGFCDHWRAGNRSQVFLDELPARINQAKTFMHWSSMEPMDKRNGGQSRHFCLAAQNLGDEWSKLRVPQENTWKPGKSGWEKVKGQASLFCGGDSWAGWTKQNQLQELDQLRMSRLEQLHESPLASLNRVDRFRLMRAASEQLGCESYQEQGFHSRAFDFSNVTECQQFFKIGNTPKTGFKKRTWLAKPVGAAPEKYHSFASLTNTFGKCTSPQHVVVEQFMDKLHLLDRRQWEARVFVLVASTAPLIVYTFDLFHVRASAKEFRNPFQVLKNDRGMTQEEVNRRVKELLETRRGHNLKKEHFKYTLTPRLLEELLARDGMEEPALFTDKVLHQVQAIVEFYFHAIGRWGTFDAAALEGKSAASFRIYAFDFVADHSLRPTLIDVSALPQFFYNTQFGKEYNQALFGEALDIVHEIHTGNQASEHRPPNTKHFHLTYHQDAVAARFWEDDGNGGGGRDDVGLDKNRGAVDGQGEQGVDEQVVDEQGEQAVVGQGEQGVDDGQGEQAADGEDDDQAIQDEQTNLGYQTTPDDTVVDAQDELVTADG